jgi:hypothetical protein
MAFYRAMFTCPKDSSDYVVRIRTRCDRLIKAGIWDGVDSYRLRSWWINFTTEEERYFAARLLDNLIYRSEPQMKAAIVQLFSSVLPNYTRSDISPAGTAEEWLESLRGTTDPKLRLVIPVDPDPAEVKGVQLIQRILKREFGVNKQWFIGPKKKQINTALSAGVETFVFLDDFVGTGSQFSRLVAAHGHLAALFTSNWCLHASLMRHAKSIEKFAELEGLRTCAVEELDGSSSLFDRSCKAFEDSANNTAQDAYDFYTSFIKRKRLTTHFKKRNEDCRYGFGGLALCYATKISAPNNALPLLWHSAGGKWNPLFPR